MKTNIILVAVPSELSLLERLDLNLLMNRALKIEGRLKKKVNLEEEQRRYNILCERIEYFGFQILSASDLQTLELSEEYLEILLKLQKNFPEECRNLRLTANFCPKENVREQITRFESLVKNAGVATQPDVVQKIAFYKKAAENNCHVLELLELSDDEVADQVTDNLKEAFLALPVDDLVTSTKETNAFISLRNHFNRVIEDISKGSPAALNFSDLAHNVITEMIWEFAYSKGKPMYLPVVYADGSKARPLPIHCLKPRPEPAAKLLPNVPILKVGEMSARHSEMDDGIGIFFYRNQEISLGRPSADSDEAAYKIAKANFAKMRNEGAYRIIFVQTGFQPAAVGFYRALIEELLSRGKAAPTLEVVPYYTFGADHSTGKPWF